MCRSRHRVLGAARLDWNHCRTDVRRLSMENEADRKDSSFRPCMGVLEVDNGHFYEWEAVFRPGPLSGDGAGSRR